MDARRVPRTTIDPKVRHVGFFAPQPHSPPLSDPPAVTTSPRRHLPERTAAVPVPQSGFRRQSSGDRVTFGSRNSSESLLGTSPATSSSSRVGIIVGDGVFSEDYSLRDRSSSFPRGGFDLSALKRPENSGGNNFTVGVDVKKPVGWRGSTGTGESKGLAEKREKAVNEVCHDTQSSSKPLKAKTTKAERRALQEAQRAAKSASKAEGSKAVAESRRASPGKHTKRSSQKKDCPPVASSVATDKKAGDHPLEKERKKGASRPPQMQFDDKNRVEKAKRRAVINQTEVRNRVELFQHLPQYEHRTQLPYLESKFFKLDSVHPAVFKVGLHYLAGDISGGNARCIAMLSAFQEVIRDYCRLRENVLLRDLTSKINSNVSFLTECRPLSMSMGKAIRFVKTRIAKLPLSHSGYEAKTALCSDIDWFINKKIIVADKVIVGHALTKVRDGDVLLTYGLSCIVEMILLNAHDLGKQFRVVVVDSRPKLEGQALLRRLVAKGLSCTYTNINAVSYIMHEVTRVFLGASAVLSNGTVYSRVGTACVAMVAHAFHVPVLICCEAYKFHERVQLDSICSNELGDPDAVAMVPGRKDVNHTDNWTTEDNLQHLNLMYDATPSDYVSAIVTDYGMLPPTSVPVIVREHRREYSLI